MIYSRSSETVDRPTVRANYAVSTVVAGARRLPADTLSYRAVKRIADVAIALVAIAVLSPVLLILALVIRLNDGGPVLYWQTRIGRNGRPFRFPKFRSMRVDADRLRESLLGRSDCDGAAFKMRNDPRVTRCGRIMRRYSLDELPQLFLVLTGTLSVVGPRPHLPQEVLVYTPEQRRRLLVQPGLVCLREVSGRSNLSFKRWIELDLEYIERRSLSTDARIVLQAILKVASGEGAY